MFIPPLHYYKMSVNMLRQLDFSTNGVSPWENQSVGRD